MKAERFGSFTLCRLYGSASSDLYRNRPRPVSEARSASATPAERRELRHPMCCPNDLVLAAELARQQGASGSSAPGPTAAPGSNQPGDWLGREARRLLSNRAHPSREKRPPPE